MSKVKPIKYPNKFSDFGRHENFFRVNEIPHTPGISRTTEGNRLWVISISQAHFQYNAKGKFLHVKDDEMGGVHEKRKPEYGALAGRYPKHR